jgi:hypothetical protein
MRHLFNPIALLVTATTVTLVSSTAFARGPAASPKNRNAAAAHQPAEKPSNDKPAVSINSSSNGGNNTVRISIVNSGNGIGNRSINGLSIVEHQPSPGPVSEPGRINGLPVIGGPQGGARKPQSGTGGATVPFPQHLNGPGTGNPGNGVVTGVFHTLPVNPGNGVVTGVFHTLPINPPGSNPPKNGIPPVYHPPGNGNHHPTPPTGSGTTTVSYFGGSVPVATAAPTPTPTADNPTTATANVTANDQTASLTNVPAGATITLDGSDFGAQRGRVSIVAGNMILPTEVVSWTEKSVNLTLPQIEMTTPMQAKFVVHRANGTVAIETPFQLCDFVR